MKNPLRFTRHSYYLLSAFFVIVGLIVVVWWPMVVDYFNLMDPNQPIWSQIDWLLIGIFFCMSILIITHADIKKDLWVVAIGAVGGFIIESWGTNSGLWHYFTYEKPPLWIIPAWPVAALSITRLTNLVDGLIKKWSDKPMHAITLITFYGFFFMTIWFIRGTLNKPISLVVLVFIFALSLSTKLDRRVLLFFLVGSFAGIFLEVWGTTRECWTYYTLETPPLFAIFAHGFAAMAFYRMELLITKYYTIAVNKYTELARGIHAQSH